MTAVVDSRETNRKRTHLCKFTNGRVRPEEGDRLKCTVFSRKDEKDVKGHRKKILVSESPDTTYIGQTFGRKSLQNNNLDMKYYVGVYDEETGKMQICDAELFHMIPHIPGREDTDDVEGPKQPQGANYAEKLGRLTEAFGSKWKKSALEKQQRNRVDEETMKDQLAAEIHHGRKLAKSQEQNKSTVDTEAGLEVIPPCNRDAEQAEHVYKLSDILSDADMGALQTPATVFFDSTQDIVKQWRGKQVYAEYILDHVSDMPMDTELRWQRSKCLMYLHYMIHLYKLSPKQLKDKNPFLENCPDIIKAKLQENFTKIVGKFRCMPSRQKDRLAAYILTLCLLIDELSLDLTHIMKDVGIERQKLFTVLKALGCKINKKMKNNEAVYYARLKLPLDVPTKTLFRQGGGKKR